MSADSWSETIIKGKNQCYAIRLLFKQIYQRAFESKMIKKSHIEYYGPIGISLYERLKKPISKYDFLFIMEQVVDTVQKLNANSLIINNVIFDIKNVFINEITKELQFIYLPLENVQKELTLSVLWNRLYMQVSHNRKMIWNMCRGMFTLLSH